MADLNQVFEALGGLKSSVDTLVDEQRHARLRDEVIFTRIESLNTWSAVANAKHEDLVKDVAEMKPHVESWKNIKQRGIALWVASVLAAGVIGTPVFNAIKAWFGKGS